MSAVLVDIPVSPMAEMVPLSLAASVLDTGDGVPPAIHVSAVMLRVKVE